MFLVPRRVGKKWFQQSASTHSVAGEKETLNINVVGIRPATRLYRKIRVVDRSQSEPQRLNIQILSFVAYNAEMAVALAAGLRAGGTTAEFVRSHLGKLFPLGVGGQVVFAMRGFLV